MPGGDALVPVATQPTSYAQVDAEAAGVLVDARDYFRAFYQVALSAEEEILRDASAPKLDDVVVLNARAEAEEKRTYVHSKVKLVDDRFPTVGSANLRRDSRDTIDPCRATSSPCPVCLRRTPSG